jgi:hypothetical protein
MRGTVRVAKSDISGAEQDLQHTIDLQPDNPAAYTRLGDVRVLQRRFADA